jgi:type IV fimbrial biogenesis protein FimT
MERQRGFTLIEVLVVILILGVLLGIATPNAVMFIQRSQAMGSVNEWISDINMARSEAIKRRTRVVVCARQDDSTCGSATDWNNGYLVFADADSDGVFDSGENLVKAVQAMGSQLTVAVEASSTGTAINSMTFRPSGGSPTATCARVYSDADSPGKAILINISGQIISRDIAAGATTCL